MQHSALVSTTVLITLMLVSSIASAQETPTPTPQPTIQPAASFLQDIGEPGGLLIMGTYDLGSDIYRNERPYAGQDAGQCKILAQYFNADDDPDTDPPRNFVPNADQEIRPFAEWLPVYEDGEFRSATYRIQPPPVNGLGIGAYMVLLSEAQTRGAGMYIPTDWTEKTIRLTLMCEGEWGPPHPSYTTTLLGSGPWLTKQESSSALITMLLYLGGHWGVSLYDDQVTAPGAAFLDSQLPNWSEILTELRISTAVDLGKTRQYIEQCVDGTYDCYGATRQAQWVALGIDAAAEESGIPVSVILMGIFLVFCIGIFYIYQVEMGTAGVRFGAMMMVFLMLPAGVIMGLLPTNFAVIALMMAVLVGLLRTFAQYRG